MTRETSTPDGPEFGRGRTLLLLATVFASGTAVMIVEMTAVRALQPFFGSTNYVWTNVIAVVLAALAAGYAIGGRLADRRPSAVLLFSIMAVGGALLCVCAWLVTPVSRLFLDEGLELEGVVRVLLRGSLGSTLILFAPPILLLGMVSPIAIRLLARGGVGRAAGRVFAVSTVGSILGTYLPVLWLVPAVGSRGSILTAAGILLGAGAVGLTAFGRNRGRNAGVALLLVAWIPAFRPMPPARGAPELPGGGTARVLAEVESPYQFLTVRDDALASGETLRVLTINEGVHTYHSLRVEGSVLTGSQIYDDYAVLPLLLGRAPGEELRGLIVGMACGVNADQWRYFWSDVYRLEIDGAEIDPEIVRLGREHFGLGEAEAAGLRVLTMDGRQMLEALPEGASYDLLVVDAFANELYIPFHLATREFFELCRGRLAPGGVLAMNVFAHGEDAPNLRAIRNTLATVFGRCVRVPQNEGRNSLLIAVKSNRPPDLARLDPFVIRGKLWSWEGWEDWTRQPEREDLLAAARSIRDEAEVLEPVEDEWLLTDDHAPIEWLTDRFLEEVQAKVLSESDGRYGPLRALLARQANLLLAVAAAWAALLAAGTLTLRRL